LYRALTIAPAPAHAIYFTGYEYFKHKFGGDRIENNPYQFAQTGSAGILATVRPRASRFVPQDPDT
jgi:hypothetical protein